MDMFFNGWTPMLRTLAVGLPAYLALVVFLRISGKRTLSKMNAFDFVVTVALGSTLATILLSPQTSLAQGAVALGLLVLAQFVITWLSVRSRRFQRLIKAQPSLLYYDGAFMDEALRRQRVTRIEVEAAARQQGLVSLRQAAAVILETDGTLSILQQAAGHEVAGEGGLLDHVRQKGAMGG